MKQLKTFDTFLNESSTNMLPSDFRNATILQVAFLNSDKVWIVDTDKGSFTINTKLNFTGKRK